MNFPVHIEFRGMAPCGLVQDRAHEHALKLGSFASDIASCRVAIDRQQKHPHEERPFGVHIVLNLPRQELAVSRVQHRDVQSALRDAFEAMKRLLEDVARRRTWRLLRQPWPVAVQPLEPGAFAGDWCAETLEGASHGRNLECR